MDNKNEVIEQKIAESLIKDIKDGAITSDRELEFELVRLLKISLKNDEEWQLEYPKERILKFLKKERLQYIGKDGREAGSIDKTQKALKSFAIFIQFVGWFKVVAGLLVVALVTSDKEAADILPYTVIDLLFNAFVGGVIVWLGNKVSKNIFNSKKYMIAVMVISGTFAMIHLLSNGNIFSWMLILFIGSFFGLSLSGKVRKDFHGESK